MPAQVFVKKGHQSPADIKAVAAPKSPFDIGPAIEDEGGTVTFESKVASFRVQLNTPRERFDQLTGQKVRDENKVIKFDKGLFVATTPEEIRAIVESKFYGAPRKGLVWRRSERQKLDIKTAVRDLGKQLQANPQFAGEVAALLKTLPGAADLFALPSREAEPSASEDGL